MMLTCDVDVLLCERECCWKDTAHEDAKHARPYDEHDVIVPQRQHQEQPDVAPDL